MPGDEQGGEGSAPQPWRRLFVRALAIVRPDLRLLTLTLSLTFVVALLNVLEPLVLKFIFDALTGPATGREIAIGVLALVGIGVGREVFGGVSNWLNWRIRIQAHYRMLDTTVEQLHTLPVSFHKQHSVGELMTRLERGIQGFNSALAEFAFNILPAVLYLALAVVMMVRLDWRLTVLVLGFAPLPALLGAWAAPEQARRERDLLDRWSRIYGRFNEVLSGIIVVKTFAREDEEKDRFLHDVAAANDVVVRGVGTDTRRGALRNLLATLARIAAIALGAYLIVRGEVTIGTLVAFLGYIGGLFGPVQGLTGVYQTMRRAGASLETIFSILDAQDRLGDAPDAIELRDVRGEVTFDRVTFGYREGQRLLDGVTLRVEAGETVALVGPSGSGKSTLMALLQRLYDPQEGRVLVDGHDLRQVKQRSLRRQIGFVPQEPVLFNDTVRGVIAYARPDSSDAEVERVARAAHAWEIVERLPEGLDTLVGERGGRLSAGERQRLAIARALLKDPALVILDEATSALDAESEALVQSALDELTADRTTFVIAHRLSTVVHADRIVVLRAGRVREEGTHGELLARGGYYHQLVAYQSGGLLADGAAVPEPRGGLETPARDEEPGNVREP